MADRYLDRFLPFLLIFFFIIIFVIALGTPNFLLQVALFAFFGYVFQWVRRRKKEPDAQDVTAS
jgi:Ca2+/Na+ antiporter